MKTDWLIVGAGFTGATLAERIATVLDQSVLVVERRNHIAGNAFDYYDESGILCHKYGPHIFHTNSSKVWRYLSQFTEWRPYFHQVLGVVDGCQVPIPFNLNSLNTVFPAAYARDLEALLLTEYGWSAKVPILNMRGHSDPKLASLAEYIYQNVFYGYTKKQWELEPEQLDASVTGRVPIHISRDDRYFQDTYQAIPKQGYTRMFASILDHPRIRVLLQTSFADIKKEIEFRNLIYTGPIDEYFEYIHGPLPYRSLRFDFVRYPKARHQPVGTVNFPNEYDFTRTTEETYLSGQTMSDTVVVYEYPQHHILGENEPYYPIPKPSAKAHYERYLASARNLQGEVYFAGRLADYRYYNMDQACARALKLFESEIESRHGKSRSLAALNAN